MSKFKKITAAFKSPWLIFAGMLAGVLLGLFNEELALKLTPLGDIFIAFLSMCVIPIMATAIITSVGRLLSSKEAGVYLKRIVLIFFASLLITNFVGLSVGLLGAPGKGLDQETRNTLGQVLLEIEAESPLEEPEPLVGFAGLLEMLVPANIFNALYGGKSLQILFFSAIFGLTIGIMPSSKSEQFLDMTEVIFKAFEKAISLAMYFLPLGLLFMLAGQVARTGLDIFLALARFIMLIHVAAFILLFFATLLISFVSKKSFLHSLRELKEPIIIALGTRNSFATMPFVLENLRQNFHLPQNAINLVVPLSIVLCRYSMVLIFTIGTIFMAQLYAVSLGISQLPFIFLSVFLAALAGAGSPSVIALSMIAIILTPMGLPVGAAIILFLASFAVIEPVLTVVNIYLTCAVTIAITGKSEQVTSEVRFASSPR